MKGAAAADEWRPEPGERPPLPREAPPPPGPPPFALAALHAREAVHRAVRSVSAEVDSILQKQEEAMASEVSRLRAEIEALRGRLASDWGVPGQNLQVWSEDMAASSQEATLDTAVVQNAGSYGSSVIIRPRTTTSREDLIMPPALEPTGGNSPSGASSRGMATLKEKSRWSMDIGSSFPVRALFSVLPGDDMKGQVKKAMTMYEQDEFVLLKRSGPAQRIARSPAFEYATLFVIALSALWISVDVDLNTAEDPRDAPLHFQVADHFFCTYFTLEILVRFAAYASKRYVFRDAWFLFDAGLVVLTVVDTWVIRLVLLLFDGSRGGDGGTTSMISRLFRLLRLARMARMVRLVTAIPELMVIVRGMAAAARSVVLTLFLLTVLTYVFAVALRQVTDGTDVGDRYFRSVPASMISLLLRGTIPDQADFLETSAEDNIFYGVLCAAFVLLGSLTLMNMLIGILVQVVGVVSETEQHNMSMANLRSRMSAVFDKYGVDSDGDKCISRKEFEHLLTIPEAVKCMSELGVDVVSLVDYIDFIFEDDAELSFPDIFALLQQLRSGNGATVRDIVDLRKFVSQAISRTAPMVACALERGSVGTSVSRCSPRPPPSNEDCLREAVRQTLAAQRHSRQTLGAP